MPNAASSRTQFSTSSRIRPNVCISASTSKVSSGRAHMKRRIAARSGDCTSAWNFVGDFGGIGAPRRRMLSALDIRGPAVRAVIFRLVLVDQPLHFDRVALPVPVAADRLRSAAGLDHHVREEQVGVDFHRRRRAPGGSTARAGRPTPACSARRCRGVIATCVGNRWLPRLQRLARKTCSPGDPPSAHRDPRRPVAPAQTSAARRPRQTSSELVSLIVQE